MKTITRSCIVVLATLVAFDLPAHAAQRMGIARGSYTLAPKTAARVSSYCMDFTREAPRAGTVYKQVLTDISSASVKFGSGAKARTMPLQQALDRGMVEIEGSNLDFARFMGEALSNPEFASRLSAEERAQFQEIRDLYNQLNTEERRQLAEMMQAEMGAVGDYTGLSFKNNTEEHLQIIVHDPMVIGEKKENIGLLDTSRIEMGDQAGIWRANDGRAQEMLAQSGIARKPDAEGSIKTQIEEFQSVFDLEKSKEMDENTEQALKRVHADQDRIARGNGGAQNYVYLMFEAAGGDQGEFRALYGSGEQVYRGQSLTDALRKAIERTAEKAGDGSVYVDLTDFGAERAAAIEQNLARVQREIAPNRKLHVLNREKIPLGVQKALFDPGIERIRAETITEITTGSRKGWFQLTIEFVKKTGETVRIYIVSSSRRALESFQRPFALGLLAPSEKSPIDVIQSLKKDLKRQGISPDELKVELSGYEIATRNGTSDRAKQAA